MRRLYGFFFLFLILSCLSAYAQPLQPAPTLHYIDAGYGAAALGMGGAFVAIANDLSAIYWNPAGLGQLPGLQFYVDYRHQGDSDEDFASEVTNQSFNSKQRFSLSGNQIQALSGSYAFRKPGFTIVPAFSFQRLSIFSPKRILKDPAETQFSNDIQSVTATGSFQEELSKGEDEYAFGIGASINKKLFIGGTYSVLRDGPEETLTGAFETSVQSPAEQSVESITLNQQTTNKYTGNYLKVGILAMPSPVFNLGGTIRFPYTRKNTFTVHSTGPFTTVDTFFDPAGNVDHIVTTQGDLNEGSGGESELRVPMEWSVGGAFRPSVNYLISGSVTHGNWKDAEESLPTPCAEEVCFPNPSVPYPTLRGTPGNQPSLLQWRVGFQYLIGEVGNGIALRTGYFRDGQPIGTDADRSFFKGFSLGLGYVSRGVHFDFAFVRETGDFKLTPASVGTSDFSNRRFVFSLGFSME